MDDWSAKPLDLVKDEVRSAIEGHLRSGDDKDDTAYEQLRMVFVSASSSSSQHEGPAPTNTEAPGTALLKKYLIALSGRVSELKACGKLVHAVLDVNWLGRDDGFVAIFVRFLGTLGSAVPGFLRAVLDRLVGYFVGGRLPCQSLFAPHMLTHSIVPSAMGRILNEPRIQRQQMISRLHNTIRYLLRLIPSANSALSESLRGQFPNHRIASQQEYVAFVKNSLKVAEYAPELKAELQTLITERLIKIDVEVQEELDDLEDEADEHAVLGLSALPGEKAAAEDSDAEDDDSDAESEASSELSVTPEEQHLRTLRDTVAKLDSVLDILFAHYTPTFASGKMYEVNDAFEHLISQFSTFVLPTYRSRHTQFLIFHYAQMSQGYAERFASVLVRLATGRSTASNSSISAAAYLASFIARGARIDKTLVRAIFTRLGNHLDTLRRNYEPACQGPSLSRYGTFYAVAQAMLYIFCFRWRDFIMTPDDSDVDDYDVFTEGEPDWLPGIKECLTQAIYSKLNPLKVCAPAIVHQFGAIASHLRFMFVIPLLETNKRLRLSSIRSVSSTAIKDMGAGRRDNTLSHQSGEAHHQLDAFFPFDPYQLPKSKKWLEGDYMSWKGVPGMQDDEDDDEDDSSDDEEDEEDDIGDIGDDPEYESE